MILDPTVEPSTRLIRRPSVTAHHRVTGPIVTSTFDTASDQHGHPASVLSDIQAVSA
jgi:hypothetical protein